MERRVELHGHRGARGLAPENTLEAFRTALALGIDALELDVAVTADGVVVVSHDPALNPDITRTADGAFLSARGKPIRMLQFAELAGYDVGRLRPGSAYAARYPDQVPADGARIPTLAEVFALDPRVRFNIELKLDPSHPEETAPPAEMADRVAAAADAAGVTDRIIVMSFDWRPLRHLRRARPEIELAWLTEADTVRHAALWWDGATPAAHGGSVPRAVAAEGGPTWSPHFVDLTAALVAEAHALGLKVRPWTVNRPDDMARMIAWGVDGLISDRPDLGRAALAQAGLKLPPAGPVMAG